MGNPQRDDTKRFFLLKGLSAEFERNCLSTIISYESRDGLSGANYDKAVKILADWADGQKVTAKPRRDTAMAIGTGGPKAAPLKQSFTRRTEPCRRFAKGACNIGTKCRYQHVDAPGRPKQIPQVKRRNVGNGPGSKRTKVFAGQCFSCGRHGHRKADCKDFKKPQDSSHVVRERVNAWPTTRTEDQAWVAHSNFDTSRQFTFSGNQEGTLDLVSAAHHEQGTTQPMVWMVDGGWWYLPCIICL